jgi:hypothetical protein
MWSMTARLHEIYFAPNKKPLMGLSLLLFEKPNTKYLLNSSETSLPVREVDVSIGSGGRIEPTTFSGCAVLRVEPDRRAAWGYSSLQLVAGAGFEPTTFGL